VRGDCPECANLWEQYSHASAEEFRAQKALATARLEHAHGVRLAELESDAQFSARMILVLAQQIQTHRKAHLSRGPKRERDGGVFYWRAS